MYPQRSQIDQAVLALISEKGEVDLRTLYRRVEERFGMTPEEISLKDQNGKCRIEHEIRWSLQTLKRKGLVTRGSGKGIWKTA